MFIVVKKRKRIKEYFEVLYVGCRKFKNFFEYIVVIFVVIKGRKKIV